MREKPKNNAYLFGPFIGELSWEFFRFSPHAIYLKKVNPTVSLIVLTRPDRFDFYGRYADTLIPLNLRLQKYHTEECFRLKNYPEENYKLIRQYFFDKYKNKYDIMGHYYPDIGWRYNVKWQYSNNLMNYDFRPREENKIIVDTILKDLNNIVYFDNVEKRQIQKYHSIDSNAFKFKVEKLLTKNSSYIGCIIELLKRCEYVVGGLNNDFSKLALLLKTPVIDLHTFTPDKIRLINPFKTPVISSENVEEGIEFYENNF